jgi:hypothetical protein
MYISIPELEKILIDPDLCDNVQWAYVAINKNITFEFIEKYSHQFNAIPEPNRTYAWREFAAHKNVPLDFIYETRDKYPWSFDYIEYHESLTYDYFLKFKEYCKDREYWDYEFLIGHPNFTLDHVLKIIYEHDSNITDFHYLSSNINLTIDFIKEHPEYAWDWDAIARNPNINEPTESVLKNRGSDFFKHNENPNYFLDYYTTRACYNEYRKYKHLPVVIRFENPIKILRKFLRTSNIKELYIISELYHK